MELKTLFKKPVVWANLLILACFVLLPFFSMNLGAWGSVSKTGLGLFWTIFERFNFLNFILLIMPVANLFVLYKIWKNEAFNTLIFKILLVAVLGILFLNIAFFAEKSSLKFVGIGLWLSLIIAIAQLFESKIVEILNKQLPEDKKLEE